MFNESDEFDLDVRLVGIPGHEPPPWSAPGLGNDLQDDELEATAPDTMGTDCITTDVSCNTSDTSCGVTCGCNTSETCTQVCANPDVISFHGYECDDPSGGECIPDPTPVGGGGGDD